MGEIHSQLEKARAIVAAGGIERISPGVWFVPSETGRGGYLVKDQNGNRICLCGRYISNHDCKHLESIRLTTGELTVAQASEIERKRPRKTYRQNWPAYNRGRRAEIPCFEPVLADLLEGIEDPLPAPTLGRPRFSFRDLVFCAVEKVYNDVGLRPAHGLSDDLLAEGWISASPSRNMISVLLRRPEVTPVLTDLVAKSSLPLACMESTFAVDASGFRTTSFGYYRRERYPDEARRLQNQWVKATIIVGTATHTIPQVLVTEGHANESPLLPALVRETREAGFVLKEVYADKGFLSASNYEAIGSTGAVPYVMFKENSKGKSGSRPVKSPFWKTMWHQLQSDPEKFLTHYHKRENVETTFSAIKKTLGETLKSRELVSQRNELLCKVIAWNVGVLIHEAFEHGIEVPGVDRSQLPARAEIPAAPVSSRAESPINLDPRWIAGGEN